VGLRQQEGRRLRHHARQVHPAVHRHQLARHHARVNAANVRHPQEVALHARHQQADGVHVRRQHQPGPRHLARAVLATPRGDQRA
jgi:hypothetical protein